VKRGRRGKRRAHSLKDRRGIPDFEYRLDLYRLMAPFLPMEEGHSDMKTVVFGTVADTNENL